jgi:hypothetical protein
MSLWKFIATIACAGLFSLAPHAGAEARPFPEMPDQIVICGVVPPCWILGEPIPDPRDWRDWSFEIPRHLVDPGADKGARS